jgi:hypothetical protein
MRLSEWRASAPNREALSARVLEVVSPVVEALGAEEDPHCWISWGDDPAVRYLIFVPTGAGLVQCSVRLALPGEGPRASAKILRWHRVQLGELAIETVEGHRLVSFQVESQVLRGADAAADRIAAFGLALFAAIDGRPIPDLAARKPGRKRASAKAPAKATRGRATPAKATRGAGPSAAKRPPAGAPGRAPAAGPATAKTANRAATRPKQAVGGAARPAGDVAAAPRPSPSTG